MNFSSFTRNLAMPALRTTLCKLMAPAFFVAVMTLMAPAINASPIEDALAKAAQYQSGDSMEALRQIETLVRQSVGDSAALAAIENSLDKFIASPASIEAKRFVCGQLAVIGTDTSLDAIATLLGNNDTVGIACLALASHPSVKAGEILRKALPTSAGAARLQMISTLGDLQDTASVTALKDLAEDADMVVSGAAVVALGKIPGDDAINALYSIRKSSKSELSLAVAEAFLRKAAQIAAAGQTDAARSLYEGLMGTSQPLHVRRGALIALFRLDKDGGQERILRSLRGADPGLVPTAIAAVPAVTNAEASDAFARELTKLNPEDQVLMIQALAQRGDLPSLRAVGRQIPSPEPAPRLAAITAMGQYGDSSVLPLLTTALANPASPQERQALEQAVAGLPGGDTATRSIIGELRKAISSAKPTLISALARRRSHLAVPVLLEESSSTNAIIARAAFQGLEKTAETENLTAVINALVQLHADEARPAAENAAMQILQKTPDAAKRTEAVCAALDANTAVATRCSLIRLLPVCGDQTAFAALQKASQDAQPQIRNTAIEAIAAWPDATAWNALVGFYQKPSDDSQRTLALRGLVRLVAEENAHPSPALFEHYRLILAGVRTDDERKLVLSALTVAAQPEALEIALPLLDIPGVRAEAALAVKKIANDIKAQHPQASADALKKLESAK
jgi:HEAT repeat protein